MPGEELTSEEMDALAREIEKRDFDERIVRELERTPDLTEAIPSDFVARVAAQVPAQRPMAISVTHYGRSVMWVCVAALFAALLFSAAYGLSRSTMGTTVEWILYIQFLAIVVWLGVRRWRTN